MSSFHRNRSQHFIVLVSFIIIICILLVWRFLYPYSIDANRTNDRVTKSRPGKRKVFLHIGPHKTGSTHIHMYLDKISDKLGQYDYCWPVPRGNIQNSNLLAIHFISNRTILPAPIEWLRNCTSHARNLIISAESFDRFTVENFREFREFLSEFDEFKVIIIYREWLNHMYSLYTEIHKYASRSMPFSEYMFKSFDYLEDIQVLNITRLVTTFSSVIGIENIYLLDYYGIMAAGKDEAYVIVCEIMGIMCEESKYLNSLTARENEKPDMISTELFQLVRNYGFFHGCKLKNENREFIYEFVKSYRSIALTHNLSISQSNANNNPYHHNPSELINVTIPISYSNLKLLQSIASLIDKKCRQEYSKILLYSNRTANIMALQNLNISEINKVNFYHCSDCMNWLHKEIYHQVHHEKRFINCTKEIILPSDSHTTTTPLPPPSLRYTPEERKEKLREFRNSLATSSSSSSTTAESREYELKRNLSQRILDLRKKASESVGVSIK